MTIQEEEQARGERGGRGGGGEGVGTGERREREEREVGAGGGGAGTDREESGRGAEELERLHGSTRCDNNPRRLGPRGRRTVYNHGFRVGFMV